MALEIIERLRRNAEHQRQVGFGNDKLLREAADIIEAYESAKGYGSSTSARAATER